MLFEELSKIKRSSIMTSIILAAVGIVMILCPPQYIESLVAVLGYGMVVQTGKRSSQKARQASLLQRKRGLTAPGGAGLVPSCLLSPSCTQAA